MKNKFNLKNVFKGVCLGVSNIIPGVSGGTTAVILGIYEKLLTSIENLKSNFKESFSFLFQIGLGALIGIFAFSGVISSLLEKYPISVNYLFIGLILGSVGVVFGNFTNKKISIKNILGFFIGLFLVLAIFFIGTNSSDSINSSDISYITLGFAGFIAAFTMILPGVSGSLSLVMLGLYDDFVNAIHTFNIPYLLAGAIGGVIGLILTAKLISYLLKNHTDITYSAILGLILGSIIAIIVSNPIGTSYISAFICVFIGYLITFILSKRFNN